MQQQLVTSNEVERGNAGAAIPVILGAMQAAGKCFSGRGTWIYGKNRPPFSGVFGRTFFSQPMHRVGNPTPVF
jgi:hypothetical protein